MSQPVTVKANNNGNTDKSQQFPFVVSTGTSMQPTVTPQPAAVTGSLEGVYAPVYAQGLPMQPPKYPTENASVESGNSGQRSTKEKDSALTVYLAAIGLVLVALLCATLIVSVMTYDNVKSSNNTPVSTTSSNNDHSSSQVSALSNDVSSLSNEVDALGDKIVSDKMDSLSAQIEALNSRINTVTTSGGSSSGAADMECVPTHSTMKPALGENICKEQKPDWPNVQCIQDAINEQAGADVTAGFVGGKETDAEPITEPYYTQGMCPVNVHWHQGTEHRSAGQYDEDGKGPTDRRAGRQGFHCHWYDAGDARFTTEYDWKHCKDMKVGETYEVHWPHSAAGACGTPNQYQTPFYDGVFCMDAVVELVTSGQVPANRAIGVQAQVFTIVNDESYYYPDLMRGMIVEGDKGMDMAIYTGSTTGDGRSNEICSAYAPITWQVDRKCHLISASTFDKMCADMKSQRDDMSDDLHAHGSRELVATEFTANNLVSGDHTKSN